MTNVLKLVLTIVIVALNTACAASIEEQSSAPKRVLFVGNSYLYYNDSLHNHVRRIAIESGPFASSDYEYKSATIGGARLSHHYIDSLLEPGRLGIDEPFDLVILQGGSMESLTEDNRKVFAEKAAEMSDKITATGAEVALYMTHAYVPPHEKFDPNMIDLVESLYVQTGAAISADVIPVGLAFARAYKERPTLSYTRRLTAVTQVFSVRISRRASYTRAFMIARQATSTITTSARSAWTMPFS